MSTPTRKVLTIVLGALFVGLIWFFFGNGESKANPVEDIIATGQQHVAAVQADVDRSVAQLQADVEEFTAQANEFVAVAAQPEKLAVASGEVASLVSAAPTPALGTVNLAAAPMPEPTKPVVPAPSVETPAISPGFSLPTTVQTIVDAVYEPVLQAVNPNYFLPEKEVYSASDSVWKQLSDTAALFTVQTVTADQSACGSNMSFNDKIACSSWIVDESNGSDGVAPVQSTGRYTPFVINSIGEHVCGAEPFGTNWCPDVMHISKPGMQYMAGNTGHDPSLQQMVIVIAHENGHRSDFKEMESRGEDFEAFAKASDANLLLLENSADKRSGRTLQTAINKGLLQQSDLETGIATIRRASVEGDPTHGGPDMREANIRLGAAQADYALAA